jgi:hypothetical protein
VCRSIRITGQPAARPAGGRSRLTAAGRGARDRLVAALVVPTRGVPGEQQPADRPVQLAGVRQEGDLRQRLLLAGGLDAEQAVAGELPEERLLPGQVGDPAA